MKLIINLPSYTKLVYLLHEFPKNEWSGPAWFHVISSKNGYPKTITLKYFHLMDIDSTVYTEWDNPEFLKEQKQLLINKKLTKCYRGNIHSHHNMEPTFSNTDNQALVEHCPDIGFFFSLIVSHSSKKKFEFKFSYKDQYNNILYDTIEERNIIIGDTSKNKGKWDKQIEQAKEYKKSRIERKEKEEKEQKLSKLIPLNPTNEGFGIYKEFNSFKNKSNSVLELYSKKELDILCEFMDNQQKCPTNLTQKQQKTLEDLRTQLTLGQITFLKFLQIAKDMDLNPYYMEAE